MNVENDFEYTIKEISEELNISKEKCRQVLLVAIKKLKNPQYNDIFKEIAKSLEDLNANKGDNV